MAASVGSSKSTTMEKLYFNGTADEYRELMGRFYDDGAQKDCQQSLF